MSESWFVRVQGKEYGPVAFETLAEWRDDGRLIPQNYLRRLGETAWTIASENSELFPPFAHTSAQAARPGQVRTLWEIVGETGRIYRRGFSQFFALSILVAVPSFGINLSLAFIQVREGEPLNAPSRAALAVLLATLALLLAAWPIFVAGLQFVTAELMAGRRPVFRDIARRAAGFWTRVVKLGLYVYGSFLFWTALPLIAVFVLASRPSLPAFFFALLALIFQVYMAGRLFINFMFWQQTSTLGGLEGGEALRASQELARSCSEESRWLRPFYRGAMLASLWLGAFLLCSAALEFPFLFLRLQAATSLEEAMAIMQALREAVQPDRITLATNVLSSVMHALLRPLLGIAFVVLYFDTKARL